MVHERVSPSMPEPTLFIICALQPGQRPPGMLMGSFDARGPTRSRVLKMARAALRNAVEKAAAQPAAWASYDRMALVAVDCDLPPVPVGPKFIGQSLRTTPAWKDYDQIRGEIAADPTRWNALAILESQSLGGGSAGTPPSSKSALSSGPIKR